MRAAAVVASAAISALGRGRAAFDAGAVGEVAPCALGLDTELSRAGLRHALVGRVVLPPDGLLGEDRAARLLGLAARDLGRELDREMPDWRAARVSVLVGTSSGGMPSIEAALAAREQGALSVELARRATYFHPLTAFRAELGLSEVPVLQILAACASSTIAIGLGCRWLDAGHCDLVIAGGYDALSALVALGFDALGALTASAPRPFRTDRDGMALGEGAGLVALVPAERVEGCHGTVLGFGASSDAFHVTAPDRSGAGLLRAARAALADAALESAALDAVSPHATATPYNDAAESRVLAELFAERRPPIQPFKASIGHTLGAAGVLEALSAWDALGRGVAPAACGAGPVVEGLAGELLERAELRSLHTTLKLSAAFGGANAALVLGASGRRGARQGGARALRTVAVRALGQAVTGPDPELVSRVAPRAAQLAARADAVSALALAAAARVLASVGTALASNSAVIVGSASATLDVDEAFDRRRRRGAPVEPRRFPATSPNLSAGLCSIAFGLTGPTLAVGSGPGAAAEALLVAHDLVAAGDAEQALVVAVEEAGPFSREIFELAGLPVPVRGARAALLAPAAGARPLDRRRLALAASGAAAEASDLATLLG